MDFARKNGVTIAYRLTGRAGAPAIAFANSLGTDARIWDAVVSRLAADYQILTYDKRGHGLSDAPVGEYGINDHVRDLLDVADTVGIDSFALVGVSVGGLISQAVAARHPGRVKALVLCDTAARIGTTQFWSERIALVAAQGMAAIADATMERWFSPDFRRDQPATVAGWRNMLLAASRSGYVATCATLRDTDLSAEVTAIAAPTLAVVGEHDISTPPDLVRATAELIPDAQFEVIRDSGHIPSIEQPHMLAGLIVAFMKDAGYV